MVCRNCGYQNPSGVAFCMGCGQRLVEAPKKPKKSGAIYIILAAVLLAVAATAVVLIFVGMGGNDTADERHNSHTADHSSNGKTHNHNWQPATCTQPETCASCGERRGSAKGHDWQEATYTTPKTCRICGKTEGEALKKEEVYINEMTINGGIYGRIWTRSTREVNYGFEFTNEDAPECWDYFDWGIPGHTPGVVRDNQGNVYKYGLHIDGPRSEEYSYGFYLNGEYTTFSGVVGCPEESKVITYHAYDRTAKYTKYFEVYGDGKLLYRSPDMRYDYAPQTFTVDVTGVNVLTIVYPATKGPNEIATIFDGKLS